VTPSWGGSGFKLESKSREERKPTWPRLVGLAVILVLAFVAARGCQDREVKVTQEEAVATAKKQVDFKPSYIQVRLLRQGLNRKAYWFVSLSIPIGFSGDRPDLFAALSVVEIDARSGEVTSIKAQSEEETAKAKAEAKRRDQAAEVREKLEQAGGEPVEG
jgi:hypothetical protein